MQYKLRYLFLIGCICFCAQVWSQQVVTGRVFDAVTKQPLPFATVKFGSSGEGTVADLDGKFNAQLKKGISFIEVRYLGYQPVKVSLPYTGDLLSVYMHIQDNDLQEVVVKPPYDKMRRIINMAIANRDKNNPDKYDWYKCHVYYKMVADVAGADSVTQKDTSENNRELMAIMDKQHLLMSETYSIRTWERPQKLQEDVLATRLSGFNKSMFTSLVTNVLPFHAYNDYITLNGKDYHNPICKGFSQRYSFNLNNEILQGKDTLWELGFHPKKQAGNELTGTVYINSNGYAIAYLLAYANDTDLKLNVHLEQQYKNMPVGDGTSKWFPQELNYIIKWTVQQSNQSKDSISYDLVMKGNSKIDSVSFDKDKNYHFDKIHTVRLLGKADELTNEEWEKFRPIALDEKERNTYHFMDSVGGSIHADRIMEYLRKLPEGKLPIGMIDIDLKRLIAENHYEGIRAGVGLQTNEKMMKWLSVGGWAGYGFTDAHWKYGGFFETYLDKYKEFVIRGAYSDDIQDPGRIHIDKALDRNYLSTYLLSRVDHIKSYTLSVKKKFGYANVTLSARHEDITPLYTYSLSYEGNQYDHFTANEMSLNVRYAYAERTAPVFGYYYSVGTKYPVLYGKLTEGSLQSGSMQVPYTQAIGAVLYNKHINRIGFEHFLITGGKSWSNDPLPLSKLFAGNGYRYDQFSLYAFGGFLTMYPYDYYSDRFISAIWRHDFDWKLYKFKIPKSKFSSAPNISLGFDYLYGAMDHREVQNTTFSVPDNGYSEAGILLNNLIRINYFNVYYITFGAGYYYHITPVTDIGKNGKFVFGLGIDL